MTSVSDTTSPEVTQALHFTSTLLGCATAAFYEIEDGQPCGFALHDVSPVFHHHYLAEMRTHDPLNVSRLLDQPRSVLFLEEEGVKADSGDPRAYRDFLGSFGLAEGAELLFRRNGQPFAGMGFLWRDRRNRAETLAPTLHAVQSYLEYNFGRELGRRELTGRKPDARPARASELTSREREVASLLCCGRTNQEIAEALDISCATVKTHLVHIFDKLGADNRTCAVALLSRGP